MHDPKARTDQDMINHALGLPAGPGGNDLAGCLESGLPDEELHLGRIRPAIEIAHDDGMGDIVQQ